MFFEGERLWAIVISWDICTRTEVMNHIVVTTATLRWDYWFQRRLTCYSIIICVYTTFRLPLAVCDHNVSMYTLSMCAIVFTYDYRTLCVYLLQTHTHTLLPCCAYVNRNQSRRLTMCVHLISLRDCVRVFCTHAAMPKRWVRLFVCVLLWLTMWALRNSLS